MDVAETPIAPTMTCKQEPGSRDETRAGDLFSHQPAQQAHALTAPAATAAVGLEADSNCSPVLPLHTVKTEPMNESAAPAWAVLLSPTEPVDKAMFEEEAASVASGSSAPEELTEKPEPDATCAPSKADEDSGEDTVSEDEDKIWGTGTIARHRSPSLVGSSGIYHTNGVQSDEVWGTGEGGDGSAWCELQVDVREGPTVGSKRTNESADDVVHHSFKRKLDDGSEVNTARGGGLGAVSGNTDAGPTEAESFVGKGQDAEGAQALDDLAGAGEAFAEGNANERVGFRFRGEGLSEQINLL